MTSVPVTDVGKQMTYINETGGTGRKNSADFMGTFKSAMESQTAAQTTAVNLKNPANDITQTKTDVDPASADSKVDVKKNDISPKDETVKNDSRPSDTYEKDVSDTADDTASENADAVLKKAGEVVKKVSEEMDVSEEEVLGAMENLGLTMTDLLDPQNMTALVTELSGNVDSVSIVTDENLYQTLGNLQDFVESTREDLMEELDLSQEALDEVLTQTEELLQHPTAEDEIAKSPMEEADAMDDIPLKGNKDFKVTVTENGEQMTMSVKVDDSTGAQSAVFQKSGENKEESGQPSKENNNSGEDAESSLKNETPLFNQNFELNNDMGATEINQTDQTATFSPEAQRIADQIMENMKANLRPEMTELEMNLHPASLGNVRVNLTAANGQVTAQFMAQNEAVKSVIESQVMQLQQQLEDQGIKVEAVEVTLASHQFENSSQQSNTNSEQSEDGRNRPKSGRIRRIDLNGLDEEPDLGSLDDGDRIAADMMARNGNTVDYTA